MTTDLFTVGAQVEHQTLGRGTVSGIVSRDVHGKPCRFVCVLIERKQLTVQLPLDDPATRGKLELVRAAASPTIAPAAEPLPVAPDPIGPETEPAGAQPDEEQAAVGQPEPSFPDGDSVRAFIREVSAEIDPTIPDDRDGFDAACVLWTGMVVGPYDQKIAEFLDLPLERVRAYANRLRGQGVWGANTIRVDWEDDETGGVLAFLMDLGVAEGDLFRVDCDGKLAYRITRHGQRRERQRRREQGRRALEHMQPWHLASRVRCSGVRLTRLTRNEQRQANLARMLLAVRGGPQTIAANARTVGVAYETANTLLKELTTAGLARRGSGYRHHGQYVLTPAGRRAAERLIEDAVAA